jgi:hypothetical protein
MRGIYSSRARPPRLARGRSRGPDRRPATRPGGVGRTRVSFAGAPAAALSCPAGITEETLLAKPNYSFEKRQRELAKKKKQEQKLEQKRQQKLAKTSGDAAPGPEDASTQAGTGEPI